VEKTKQLHTNATAIAQARQTAQEHQAAHSAFRVGTAQLQTEEQLLSGAARPSFWRKPISHAAHRQHGSGLARQLADFPP